MNVFPEFVKVNGPGKLCEPANPDVCATYERNLPKPIIEFWKNEGFCAYAGGLIWVTNPTRYSEFLEDLMDTRDNPVVIARTAWGDLYLWEQEGVNVYHAWTGSTAHLTNKVEQLFESSFVTESYLENALSLKLFRQVLKKLGPLEADECYGFAPAPKIGGKAQVANAQKVKIKKYLGMLAQL